MNWIDFMPSLPMVLGLPVTRRDGGTGIIIGLDHASLNNGVFHVLQTDEPT